MTNSKSVSNSGTNHLGLPKGDPRIKMKTTFGYSKGTDISFMLNLTPCRTFLKEEEKNKLWFHLDSRFMKTRTARCMSGIPDRGYCASNPDIAFKLFLWFSMSRTFGTVGYPMWANMEEMWVPSISEKNKKKVSKYIYAIAFAENDCVQVTFPANNPVKGSPEVMSANQMSPLNKDTYWNKNLAEYFDENGKESTDILVIIVNKIYSSWQKRFRTKKSFIPNYTKSYLLADDSCLTVGAGLVQIKDFAVENNETDLLSMFAMLSEKIKEIKLEFHELLVSKNGLAYFNQRHSEPLANQIATASSKTRFETILEKRKSVASFVIKELQNDENLGSVKLAKILYIIDYESDMELEANYVKDVAGPVDARMLYNSKVGLFPNGQTSELGKITETTFKKDGEVIKFKKISSSTKTGEWSAKCPSLFGDKFLTVKNIIKLFKPLTTDHSEAVATLYACWNELILSKKNPTDQMILKDFYKWSDEKDKFEEEELLKTIQWMRRKKLIPKGKGRKLAEKFKPEIDVPF